MDLFKLERPISHQACYRVFEQRDQTYDGFLYLGVKTTGIFCRPACPARLPKIENCTFHETAQDAVNSGYRACKRCHPTGRDYSLIETLIGWVEEIPEISLTSQWLKSQGVDPLTARRHFLARFGIEKIIFSLASNAKNCGASWL